MCGIAGFYQFRGKYNTDATIKLMISQLTHRGPDDFGVYTDQYVGLGHRRLSILDLSQSGHQPMFTDDRAQVIVFNGEIYNFPEIKKELVELGYNFRSTSDTEVILKGFAEWGEGLFIRLNGIFAFALWDHRNFFLYIVRDRLGVKPVYIYQSPHAFYFASEIKAIRAVCPGLNHINKEALPPFLYYGNSLGDQSLFQNIQSLSPGSFLVINDTGAKKYTYWSPEKINPNLHLDERSAIEKVKALLEQAVKRQLISDVPVGVFLSGGIDSSAITAFASKHYDGKIKTFTAAFDFSSNGNELAKAKRVAEYFGTEHHEFFIEAHTLPDIIEKMVYHHDQPFSDAANIPLFLMAQHVKPFATVVLQGDGGDELFGGYRRYSMLQKLNSFGKRRWAKLLSSILGNIEFKQLSYQRLVRMVSALGQTDDAMLMALLLTVDTLKLNTYYPLSTVLQQQLSVYDPFEHYKITNKRFIDKDIVQRMLYIDTQIILPNTFLEKVDKSTMAASVEVRVPLLDNELVDFVMALPSSMKIKNGEKKWLLKRALRGKIPDHILDAPKTGFGVPYQNWLRKPLYNMMNDHFRTKYIEDSLLFDYKKLDKMIIEHRDGILDHGFSLWKLMNLCIWIERNKIVFD